MISQKFTLAALRCLAVVANLPEIAVTTKRCSLFKMKNLPRGVENENATPTRLRAKSNSHFSFKKFLF